MSDFQKMLEEYENSRSSVAQQQLAENDQIKTARGQSLQASASTLISETGTTFGDKVKEQAQKLQSELGLDVGLGQLAPRFLSGASSLAKMGQSALVSRWKTVNARRFNERENAPEEEDVGPEAEEEMPSLSQNANEMELQPAFDPKLFKGPEETPEPETSETSFMDGMPTEDEIGKAQGLETEADTITDDIPDTSALTSEEAGIESNISSTVEDLAPELTAGAEVLGTVGGALGDAIPFIGGIIGIASAVTGAIGIADTIKEEDTDPYASIKGQISQYKGKIDTLQSQVSADQFQQKLGAATPSFGSLSVPQFDTAKQSSIALHS